METEGEDVKTEPFEEVMIEEPTHKQQVEVGEPSTSRGRKKGRGDTVSSAERAEIAREIEQIKQLVQREKQGILQGPKIQSTDDHIFQFTITLVRGTPHKVWRCIQVPARYTFHEFHVAIQKAMGWKSVNRDYHLHRFVVLNLDTLIEDTIVMSEYTKLRIKSKDEKLTKVRDYFKVLKFTGTYVYDFALMWTHSIVFEDFFLPIQGAKYPKCIVGEKACPNDEGVEPAEERFVDPDQFDPDKCFED